MSITSNAYASSANSVTATTALSTSQVVKGGEGVLRMFSGRIDETAPTGTYFLQMFNSATVPADATILTAANMLMAPTKVKHVSGQDDSINLDFTADRVYASLGISWCLSTTEFTKTLAGSYVSATALYQ